MTDGLKGPSLMELLSAQINALVHETVEQYFPNDPQAKLRFEIDFYEGLAEGAAKQARVLNAFKPAVEELSEDTAQKEINQ